MSEGDPGIDVQSTVNLEAFESILEEEDVQYAVVFGSYADGTQTPTSDIDICLRFSDSLDRRERFRARNRIDATVQAVADPFVDVSDIEGLPDTVAHRALTEGTLIYGDESTKDADEDRLSRTVDASAERRAKYRRKFIDRLAEGDV
ncbi:type VII toxin-antitoxin system MntA family adenylyltransferase antitoxin [Halovivax gelatinilyticus]|uniref:type VII toxin-antitoxin system MntA family adenylyltransferase antitoxin n=1 Tax=Halovivax gelatinilyticus TaxID=2961597 RepID=UPI0020CA300B|nr:nucleotidyltransferase domain-containing protein [Halovivax gelatinilyticus]